MGRKKLRVAMKLKKKLLASCAALLLAASLGAQENLVIRKIQINAQGGTKEGALKKALSAKEGMAFESRAALDQFIASQKQELANKRLFESVEIEAIEDEDGNVDLIVQTVDTGHLLLLPYYKYSSNDGHTIKAKFKDDNFMGLMSPFSADAFLQYEKREGKSDDFVAGASASYALPFSLGPVQASWNNNHAFKYAFVRAEPEWNLNTGLTFSLPFQDLSLRLDLTQGFVRDADYKVFGDELYWLENAKFSVPIILERFKSHGNLVYTPALEFDCKWTPDGINAADEDLISPRLIVSHGLGAGQVNWIENFRRGWTAQISQSAAYNFQSKIFQPGFKLQVNAFAAWKRAGLNSRLLIFAERERFVRYGEFLRGIGDDQYFAGAAKTPNGYSAKSAAAIILNLDLPIKLMSVRFENWGMKFLRPFNMEVQIAPFVDVALAANRATGRVFDPRDGFYCAGVEVLLFPNKWKSVQIRASAGIDAGRLFLKKWIDTSWRDQNSSKFEVTLGIGLFY